MNLNKLSLILLLLIPAFNYASDTSKESKEIETEEVDPKALELIGDVFSFKGVAKTLAMGYLMAIYENKNTSQATKELIKSSGIFKD